MREHDATEVVGYCGLKRDPALDEPGEDGEELAFSSRSADEVARTS